MVWISQLILTFSFRSSCSSITILFREDEKLLAYPFVIIHQLHLYILIEYIEEKLLITGLTSSPMKVDYE